MTHPDAEKSLVEVVAEEVNNLNVAIAIAVIAVLPIRRSKIEEVANNLTAALDRERQRKEINPEATG